MAHHWPGNVRELRNVMERAVILELGDEVQAESLPDFALEMRLRKGDYNAPSPEASLEDRVAQYEKDLIINMLEQSRYNLTKTAEQLRLSRHALRYRMQRLNIETSDSFEDEPSAQPGKEPA